MARQPNYGFDKRRKELARKEKQEQKRLRKIEEAKARAEPQTPAVSSDETAPVRVSPELDDQR
jgi:hypothetical protein